MARCQLLLLIVLIVLLRLVLLRLELLGGGVHELRLVLGRALHRRRQLSLSVHTSVVCGRLTVDCGTSADQRLATASWGLRILVKPINSISAWLIPHARHTRQADSVHPSHLVFVEHYLCY